MSAIAAAAENGNESKSKRFLKKKIRAGDIFSGKSGSLSKK
jgi:hypothetical protein